MSGQLRCGVRPSGQEGEERAKRVTFPLKHAVVWIMQVGYLVKDCTSHFVILAEAGIPFPPLGKGRIGGKWILAFARMTRSEVP